MSSFSSSSSTSGRPSRRERRSRGQTPTCCTNSSCVVFLLARSVDSCSSVLYPGRKNNSRQNETDPRGEASCRCPSRGRGQPQESEAQQTPGGRRAPRVDADDCDGTQSCAITGEDGRAWGAGRAASPASRPAGGDRATPLSIRKRQPAWSSDAGRCPPRREPPWP